MHISGVSWFNYKFCLNLFHIDVARLPFKPGLADLSRVISHILKCGSNWSPCVIFFNVFAWQKIYWYMKWYFVSWEKVFWPCIFCDVWPYTRKFYGVFHIFQSHSKIYLFFLSLTHVLDMNLQNTQVLKDTIALPVSHKFQA